MKTPTLISLGFGGATALAGTGVAINHFYSGDSIKAHIEKTSKPSNKIFLISKTDVTQGITEKYNASNSSKRPKPKRDGKVVEAKDLGKWCEEAVKEKFNGEDNDTYKEIMSWCYINVNSFAEELKKNDNKKLSTEQASHQAWKTAWTAYSTGKSDSKLKIVDTSRDSTLNGNQEEAGATALHAWCTEKASIKLYEDDAEATYALFVKWCPKVNAEG